MLPVRSIGMNIMVGKRVLAFGKSIHAGQEGTVVADYGTMLLVEASDPSYKLAFKNNIGDGRYFQVDNLLVKEVKIEGNEQ